jgi:uncharacterized protein (UPF0147 family)
VRCEVCSEGHGLSLTILSRPEREAQFLAQYGAVGLLDDVHTHPHTPTHTHTHAREIGFFITMVIN